MLCRNGDKLESGGSSYQINDLDNTSVTLTVYKFRLEGFTSCFSVLRDRSQIWA